MHPIIHDFGFLVLRWYGVLIATGLILAYRMFRKRAPGLGLNESEASNLIFLLFFSGVLGARAYFVIWNWSEFFAGNPREIFMIQHGGLVFFGGFLAACTTLILWTRLKKKPLPLVADALVPSLALGHAFGRLGCFMQGCCYGKPCDHFWAVRPESPAEVAGMAIHPTQIYEFLGLLNIVCTLLVLERTARYPGKLAWSYCLLYSMLRFLVEFWRGDVPHDILGRFTLAQAVSGVIFVVAWVGMTRSAMRAFRVQRTLIRQATTPTQS